LEKHQEDEIIQMVQAVQIKDTAYPPGTKTLLEHMEGTTKN